LTQTKEMAKIGRNGGNYATTKPKVNMSISDIRNELARELSLRRTVFPRLILAGRLTQGESDERMERLHAGLHFFARLCSVRPDMPVQDLMDHADRWAITAGTARNLNLNIIKAGV
jgi:hypothetical protein